MQVWRNCQILSEQKSGSPALLNAMRLFKVMFSIVNSIVHISFRNNCNRTSEGLLYVYV
jgi:hypothetical protein